MSNSLKTWLIARAREPSTWAGIAGIIGAAGITLAPEMWEAVVGVAMALASLAAVLLREKPSTEA